MGRSGRVLCFFLALGFLVSSNGCSTYVSDKLHDMSLTRQFVTKGRPLLEAVAIPFYLVHMAFLVLVVDPIISLIELIPKPSRTKPGETKKVPDHIL